ncbi:hypothetical protein ACFS07_06660 [Undibacterium arcticum]
MIDHLHQFKQGIEDTGLTAPTEIHVGGKPQHFNTNGKYVDDSGCSDVHLDGRPLSPPATGLDFLNGCALRQGEIMSESATKKCKKTPLTVTPLAATNAKK